jgi:heme oxygenase
VPLRDQTAVPAQSPALALRERTADNHKNAERSDFQRKLVSGQLDKAGYIGSLEQMWFVYRALAAQFNARRGSGAIFSLERDRTADLDADLNFFGLPAKSREALPSTWEFVGLIGKWGAAEGAELVGPLYVLEGSTNGSKFIARAVRKAYGLDGAQGTAFLDPYGDEQTAKWQAFRAELDSAVAVDQVDAVVESAKETFDAVTAIGAELLGRA